MRSEKKRLIVLSVFFGRGAGRVLSVNSDKNGVCAYATAYAGDERPLSMQAETAGKGKTGKEEKFSRSEESGKAGDKPVWDTDRQGRRRQDVQRFEGAGPNACLSADR